MKVTKNMVVFLACIFTLTVVVYLFTIKGARASDRRIMKNKGEAGADKFDIQQIPLPQANMTPDVNILPSIPPMPTAKAMNTQNNVIANFPDLDRAPLDDESISLLPANEMIADNYKDWYGAGLVSGESVDKELYAKGKPLFNQTGKHEVIPLDVNGEKRRVNFY